MYRVLSLSLVAAALALFSSSQAWAQNTGNRNDPANRDNAGANQGKAMEGKFVETEGANKFVMTDQNGRNEHTHTLAPDAKVMCDGKACRLSDLRKGALIRVWSSPADKEMAVKVEATTKDRFDNQPGRPGSEVNR